MKIELDLPEIEGYEYTGEFRVPAVGEYISFNNKAKENKNDCLIIQHIILKKKAPKYHTFTSSHPFHECEYVEIKALEDALTLMGGRVMGGNDTRVYTELKSLIS
jgi:hypothetical protein